MGHAHSAPALPDTTDEAGDSPRWVPLLGIGLFVLAVVGIVAAHAEHDPQVAEAAQHE